jgi:hypothetical protein
MKKLLILAISFYCLILSSCATEKKTIQPESMDVEKCYAPVWNEGDSWKFIGGGGNVWEEKIVGSTLTQIPRKRFHGILNIPFVGLKIFPLWVGKKVEGTEHGRTVEGIDLIYTYSFRVIEVLDLKVEAGTFKAYKIEFKLSTIYGQEGVAYHYYSPETKSIVKFETKSHILSTWQDYELSSFRPKQ